MVFKQFSTPQVFDCGQTTSSEPPPTPSDCPRCGSSNTKFCYYNNYNKSQPRHFCKSCKRHWTKGGALRNIPAGRRRRNKRHRPSVPVPAAQPRQEAFPSPFSVSTNVQDDMSDILYRALVGSSSSPPSTVDMGVPHCTILESHAATFVPQNQNAEFTFSTAFNYHSSGENLESTEESTVTTTTAPPPPPVNPAADLWNWNNEIDFLGSTADAYALWDNFGYYYPR